MKKHTFDPKVYLLLLFEKVKQSEEVRYLIEKVKQLEGALWRLWADRQACEERLQSLRDRMTKKMEIEEMKERYEEEIAKQNQYIKKLKSELEQKKEGNADLTDILHNRQAEEVTHEWVDLDLYSGTLWATCNVGAQKPEDKGDCFAWGETQLKKVYKWETYKHCWGHDNTLTKYNTTYYHGSRVDDKTELDLENDAAYVNWGEDWRMPSEDQFEELLNDKLTTQKWTTREGQLGLLITSIYNGNSIFLPVLGHSYATEFTYHAISLGVYWSRTLDTYDPSKARLLYFDSDYKIRPYGFDRCYGFCVRPVRR